MDGIRPNRFAAGIVCAALLLCAPFVASAQDAPEQAAPTPTATSVPILTDPRIPGDFSLPSSGDATPVIGPARPADAPAREIVQPQPVASPARSVPEPRDLQVEPEPRAASAPVATQPQPTNQAQRRVAEPQSAVSTGAVVDSPITTETRPGETSADPAADHAAEISSEEVPEPIADSSFMWTLIAFLVSFLAIAALVLLLRRFVTAFRVRLDKPMVPEVIEPLRITPASKPTPAPMAPPQPQPAPVARQPDQSGLVQSRIAAPRGNGGLVTTRAPATVPQPPKNADQGNGLVTTNLAEKRRDQAQAEALEKRRTRPASVNRKISFDWN